MEDALKEKLARVLSSPIETEERIVYFFVGLRKMMERTKTKEKFPVVNFYCNWVLHIGLSNSPVADGILLLMDDGLAESLSGTLSADIVQKLNDLVNDDLFRVEMRECLEFLVLPSTADWSIEQWSKFRSVLGLVIADCPLSLRRNKSVSTRYVESVTLSTTMGEDGIAINEWKAQHRPLKVLVKNIDGERFIIRPHEQ
jgi:hypothetical protein